jgi:8-oxo-dGTP diphosphatase
MSSQSGAKTHFPDPVKSISESKICGKDYIGVGVGALIINEQNEVLLLLRKKPPETDYWSIPGGSVEMFETIEDAITREIKEELNVEIKIVKLLGVTDHILKQEKTHWVAPVFLAEIIKNQKPVNAEPESHYDMRWFSIHKLPQNITLTTSKALQYLPGKR